MFTDAFIKTHVFTQVKEMFFFSLAYRNLSETLQNSIGKRQTNEMKQILFAYYLDKNNTVCTQYKICYCK